jgi:sugar/nucleoside kinase (ribokinase family)
MNRLNPVNGTTFQYDHIVATGGIGSGMFFSLAGNNTLGRNESRMASLLPSRDFCKQHIIMHYVAVLLGAKPDGDFQSFPIGKVGNDDIGKNLVCMMSDAGMNVSNVEILNNKSTLFSVCYQYPDHAGGNITTENSASSSVSPEDITSFFNHFPHQGKREIILAAPEVPLAARCKLLEYGNQRGSLNVASLLSGEATAFLESGIEWVDILSINIDEARSIANVTNGHVDTRSVVDACIERLISINPEMVVLITAGKSGSYSYAAKSLEHTPSLSVPVLSTAGAGDAFLAGVIAALCCGLPLQKGRCDETFSSSPARSAVELGTLLASLSVTSADTIHLSADATQLLQFARKYGIAFSSEYEQLFTAIEIQCDT